MGPRSDLAVLNTARAPNEKAAGPGRRLREVGRGDEAGAIPLERRQSRAMGRHLRYGAQREVKQRFTEMYTELRFTPRMHIWVEMFIAKHGGLADGYVKSRGDTGLSPDFAAADC